MHLKSLELHGFKSFAKKCGLDFKTPITSIVGPNGSGKSNVAEAFRFALGEQSFKSMRGKKGEDLIWNGNSEIGRANRASVKIVFDNRRRFLNLDFDEVSIERAVFRDGVNEYSINGSRVRLRDILELLASAHIGASGHHIISQGEADRILNSNARERKAMVEDALGLKIYQHKMEESERRLGKTEENIKSVESLRREVLPHLKFLRKQVDKIEKAQEMKSRLGLLYKEYLKRENIYLAVLKADLVKEKAPIEKSLTELERDLKEAKSILERSKFHDKKSERIIFLEENIREIRERKDELTREIGRVEGRLASEERILKRERELTDTREQNVPFVAVEGLASGIEERLSQAEDATEPSGFKRIVESVRALVSGFVAEHKSKSGVRNAVDSEKISGVLKKEKQELDKKLADVRSEENDLSTELLILSGEIKKEENADRAAEKKVFEVLAAQNDIIAKRNAVRTREESLKIEEEDYKRELGEAAAIIGREVLDFENFAIGGDNGYGQSRDEDVGGIIVSSRQAQHERRRELEKIKIRLEESGIGAPDDVTKEYNEVSERDAFLTRELEDLEKSAESLEKLIVDLAQKISTEFAAGLEKINKQFEEFFSLMFGGGQAKLVLVREKKRRPSDTELDLAEKFDGISGTSGIIGETADEETEVVEEGIEISVNLPRKKVKGLMMLSGGERALTSIALIFAMSQVKPPPFIILDETDAALDESNSKKYGDMIENLAKCSQLILITHNRETMSRAGVLYGVTMLSGASKLLSIKFNETMEAMK